MTPAYPARTQAVLGVGFARRTSQGPSWTQLVQAKITVTTPAHRAKRVHVMVTTAGGGSSVTGATTYAFR